MKIESLIEDSQTQILPTKSAGVVLGDEGCIYRALDDKWRIIFQKATEEGFSVRYLTPIVPQKHVDEMFLRIKDLASKAKFKVTFNDYGLLYMCRDLIAKDKIIPVAGRIITRSVLDCPWYKRLFENEPAELSRVMSNYSFSHRAKDDFLKDYGIKEIELNLRELGDFNVLKKEGLILTGHISNAIISVGRHCFTARWYGLQKPGCRDDIRCRNRLTITPEQIWGKRRLMYEEPNTEMKDYFKGCFVQGNAVYSTVDSSRLSDVVHDLNYVISSDHGSVWESSARNLDL